MTQGLSGTFAFNDVNINQYPTTHKWVERTQYGVDGNGHPLYGQVRSYEMVWNLISGEDAQQIIGVYNSVGNTGTVTSCLPEWGALDYRFKNYSGTTLVEPVMNGYFQTYIEEVKLLVLSVNTNQ